MTEKDHIDGAQTAIKLLKDHLRAIQKINQAEGRVMAANAAMKRHGQIEVFHAECLSDLKEHWPEGLAEDVSIKGGGGR
jgi:hypothetical protein